MNSFDKILLTGALILLGLGILFIFQSQSFGVDRLIFCDVGQGDGMVLISKSRQVVIDGGPGRKMSDCLSKYMPFWDRKVEMMVLTHPQKDHMEGLIDVLARYEVAAVVSGGIPNVSGEYKAFSDAVKGEKARVYIGKRGDKFVVGQGLTLRVLWPFGANAPQGKPSIEDWKKNAPKDLNEPSIVMRLEIGSSTGSGHSGSEEPSGSMRSASCVYLTGDILKEILQGLIDRSCQVLKIAHHGSKTGTNIEILDKVKPKIAVIQVGKNSFGHPHKEVIEMLESKGVKILRNDTNGIIEIISDGKSYKIKTEK